jgi:7-carboxy-7-deazaguanine synthase
METVRVSEMFTSIQGESTYAGWTCFFVRLAGCNLHCAYCDTPQAREATGNETAVSEIVDRAAAARAAMVEITGGEPLVQEGFPALARALLAGAGKTVLVETNGSRDLSLIPDGAIAIVDIKTPGSGEADSFDAANLDRLRPYDEIKFVLCDRPDYEWAARRVRERELTHRCRAVHFSPAWGALDPRELAGWMIEDGLDVRLQVQLHRTLGMR